MDENTANDDDQPRPQSDGTLHEASPTRIGDEGELDPDFLDPPEHEGEIGRLAGYKVLRIIGQGGMGVVFEAEDLDLGRKVALKVMRSALAANRAAVSRFLREAKILASITHDNVVTIYQVGEHKGTPFIAMEFLHGMPLSEKLREKKPLDPKEYLRIGMEVARGLQAAHELGLIHRDIKPGNIWLDSNNNGRVRILDFGLARTAGAATELTESGMVVGTPSYMAPEQARSGEVDARCDLFSLGCLLYRMSTGKPAFGGKSSIDVILHVTTRDPTPPSKLNPDIPAPLEQLILALMEKQKEHRPKSSLIVLEQLRQLLDAQGGPTRRHPPEQPSRPIAGRVVLALCAVAVLAGLATVAWYFIPKLTTTSPKTTPSGDKVASLETPSREKPQPPAEKGVPSASKPTTEKPETTKPSTEKPDPGMGKTKPPDKPIPPVVPKRVYRLGEPMTATAWVQKPLVPEGLESWSLIGKRHGGGVTVARYSTDGSTLATAAEDGAIRFYDTKDYALQRIIIAHADAFRLEWSPDGKHLLTAGYEPSVKVWDANTGKLLRTLEADDMKKPRWLAWSPDGNRVAVSTDAPAIHLWNPSTGDLVRTLTPKAVTWELKWSPDSKFLAYADSNADKDNDLVVVDASSGAERHRVPGHRAEWNADGSKLLVADASEITLWDASTWRESGTITKEARQVGRIELSRDGKFLAGITGLEPGRDRFTKVTIWNTTTGNVERVIGTEKLTNINTVDWSPDGQHLAVASAYRDSSLRIFDAATGKQVAVVNSTGNGTDAALAPEARSTVWFSGAKEHTISRLETATLVDIPEDAVKRPVTWSRDGKAFVAGNLDDDNTLWYWRSGAEAMKKLAWDLPIRASAVSKDGSVVAVCLDDGTIESVQAPDGKKLGTYKNDTKYHRVLLAPDAKSVLVWRFGGIPVRIDLENSREMGQPFGETNISQAVWSDDGSRIAALDEEDTIHVAEVAKNRILATEKLSGSDIVLSLAWATEPNRIVVSYVNSVELLDENGKHQTRRTFQRVGTPTADGRIWYTNRFASHPEANVVLCWDIETGSSRGALASLGERRLLQVSPSGHFRAPTEVDAELLVVIRTPEGQESLTLSDFEKRFGWKNDPKKVDLSRNSTDGVE